MSRGRVPIAARVSHSIAVHCIHQIATFLVEMYINARLGVLPPHEVSVYACKSQSYPERCWEEPQEGVNQDCVLAQGTEKAFATEALLSPESNK